MTAAQCDIMHKLYHHDIWEEFAPTTENDEVQGWNGDHYSLRRLAEIPGSRVVIDVGVWKGQSTITLASAMKRLGFDGCVIAVDTFLGSPEHWHMPDLYTREYGRPDIYSTFLSNVYNAGVAEYVVPLAQTSVTAATVLQSLCIEASIIHIDAAHEYAEVVRDADEYWKVLKPGGFLIGDDYAETWPGVIRGADEFAAKHGLPLTIEWPKWIVQKP